MGKQWYPKALGHLGSGDINLGTASIKCIAVDTGAYTYSAAHEVLADVASGARIGTSAAIAQTWSATGVLDADDFLIPCGANHTTVEALVYYSDGATKYLLVYDDTGSGLPITPNGSLLVTVNASGIAAL